MIYCTGKITVRDGLMENDIGFDTIETMRHISLDARLTAAMELAGRTDTFADIGCDHGRLVCAMLQRGLCARAIAADISAPSLEKAAKLSEHVGLSDQIELRVGSGLSVLRKGEADTVAVLGMGGKLIAELLSDCPVPLMGAKRAIIQPMRGVEDLRSFLWENGYRIEHDRAIEDGGRLYQVMSVLPPDHDAGRDTLPAGFPPDCFTVGYRALDEKDPLLKKLVSRELDQCTKRLREAMGTEGEARLMKKKRQCEQILSMLDVS